MHFPIIVLEKANQKEEFFIKDLNPDDPVLLYNTDYFGNLYTKKERQEVIESKWLSKLLSDVGTIDSKTGIITLFKTDTIKKNIKKYLEGLLLELSELNDAGKLKPNDFIYRAKSYRNSDALFYINRYGYTAFEFIDWALYESMRDVETSEWKVGNIIDAHN